jgi:anti-anti-sigma regulatory factor
MATGKTGRIALPGVMDLDALDMVRDQLVEALDAGSVAIDGAEVGRVATNALFMLLSAAETARRNNVRLTVTAPSTALTAAIDRLGLGAQFADILEG